MDIVEDITTEEMRNEIIFSLQRDCLNDKDHSLYECEYIKLFYETYVDLDEGTYLEVVDCDSHYEVYRYHNNTPITVYMGEVREVLARQVNEMRLDTDMSQYEVRRRICQLCKTHHKDFCITYCEAKGVDEPCKYLQDWKNGEFYKI